ncbi:MAG: efflux RND transporter periplasmic adaptor subunit, partial [Burkholderiaceae bacterium]
RLKAERLGELVSIEAVSRQDADDARALYRQAVATVAQQKAALESAQIQLRFTKVTAPISGRIGRSAVTQGALVAANQTDALAVIRALDPMYVDMNQSSAALLRLKRQLGSGRLDPGATEVSLRLEDGSIYAHTGEMKFSEVAVDEQTGSVTLRATFPNPEGLLLPGMYVQSIVSEAVEPQGILVPQQGIARDVKGNGVALVVDAQNKVEQRSVVTSRALGNQWLIESGLKAGDRLIVEGVEKTRAGAVVEPIDMSEKFRSAQVATADASTVGKQ